MGHEGVQTLFVVIAALALVAQAGIFYGIFQAMRQLQADLHVATSTTKQRLDEIAETVAKFLADSRDPVRTITSNLAEISVMLRNRTTQVDAVVAELMDRSRLQVIRVDQMLTGMLGKVETTAETVERGVLAPLNEASAVIKGVQKGLEVLFSRRRTATASEARNEEQMFI
jgi:ABC-type transporter Mla subunit MlaD